MNCHISIKYHLKAPYCDHPLRPVMYCMSGIRPTGTVQFFCCYWVVLSMRRVRAREELRIVTSSYTRCAVYITVSYFLLGHSESGQIDYQHRTAAAHQEGITTIQRRHHPFGLNSKPVDVMRLPSMVQGSCHGWGSINFLGNFKPQLVVQVRVQSTTL